MSNGLGLIEFAVVALFAICWGILELQGKRLDKKKVEREKQKSSS